MNTHPVDDRHSIIQVQPRPFISDLGVTTAVEVSCGVWSFVVSAEEALNLAARLMLVAAAADPHVANGHLDV